MQLNQVDLILNTIDNGIILLDENLNILFWNHWLESRTGIKKDEIKDQNICTLFPYINQKTLKRKIKSTLILNSPSFYSVQPHHYLIDIKLSNITDSVFESMQQNVTIVPYDIEKKHVALYIYDATPLSEVNHKLEDTLSELEVYKRGLEERVKTEVQKNRQKDELLTLQSKMAAMGEMLGSIAHQWRQPLNALGINIQYLEEDLQSDIINKEYIDNYTHENMQLITFMSETIDDFRNFYKIDKVKSTFDAKEKSKKILDILSSRIKAHQIHIEFAGDSFIVLGYPSEFQQVILNIVNNAIDELIEKEVKNPKISLYFQIKEFQGFIEIQDNAGGIEQTIVDRIFEPYFTTKDEGEGTGLGLYMSKMIIEDNMNGKIKVKNEKNGALFTIALEV